MFRLITLLVSDGHTVAYPEADGYSTEPAAWAAYSRRPEGLSGIGHHDADGRLIQLIVDQTLDPDGDVAGWNTLAVELGVRVRTVPMSLRLAPEVDVGAIQRLTVGIERQLPRRIGDPRWRAELCDTLGTEPLVLAGVVNAVHHLPYWAALDLYPYLQDLAAELPAPIRLELCRHVEDRMTGTGVAAARLGL